MKDILLNSIYSIYYNKLRSFLTLLGIVIGVTAVTTLISIGQGLKNDVSKLIQGFGTNVIIVVPGKLDLKTGQSVQSPANLIATDILTMEDFNKVSKLSSIESSTPLSLVTGNIKYGSKSISPTIFGSYPSIISAFEILKLEKGRIFEKDSGNVIILGAASATQLFGDENPVGRKVSFRNTEFEVIGTFSKSKSTGISGTFSSEIDNMSAIPFDTATTINKNQIRINRLVFKVKSGENVKNVKEEIKNIILKNHGEEENFTVLTQDDILELFNQFLNLATAMVSAIAAISIIVGGIGIMNIMFVTITERTREIGLRKAVGATKKAILAQFLIEATIITIIGGIIGLGISFVIGFIVKSRTSLAPVITPQTIALALTISIVVGIIFGLWPAIKAARKDPIEALRYE